MRSILAFLFLFLTFTAFAGHGRFHVEMTEQERFDIINTFGKYIDFSMRELSKTEKSDLVSQISLAEGARYVWGGHNPEEGIDCSGLLIWAYGKLGYLGFRKDEDVVFDVTSHEMYSYAVASASVILDMNQFLYYEKGDLLFLDVNGDGKVDHVAVFMHYDPQTRSVWVWDASTNTGKVSYREMKNILKKNPKMGRPTLLEPLPFSNFAETD